jgi:putative phosphoesterase
MKIAALGDIHGNYQALITVLDDIDRWHPDLVVVVGDIINRGPRSKECLDLILDRAKTPHWHVIKGNHEDYVLDFTDPDFPRTGLEFELRKIIYWTYQSLTSEDIQRVIDLPRELTIKGPESGLIRLFHASTAGERIGIYPFTLDEKLPELIDLDSSLFIVGHTHQPLIRQYNQSTIVNVGSVGLPFDGDTRPSYAQLTLREGSWQGEIIRLEYDRTAAKNDFLGSGFIPDGGIMAELVLAEVQLGWPQLGKWFKKYETDIMAKKLTPEKAVAEFLLDPNIEAIKSSDLGQKRGKR